MPNSNNNQVNIRDLTAQEIIEQFRVDLLLPVCDDQAAIEDSIKKQSDRYHRMENRGSPSERERVKNWFKNTSALKDKNKRAEYLDTVYEFFAHYADGQIITHIDAGKKNFDKKLEDNFRKYLIDNCRVDKQLESDFINRYKKQHNIQFGGKLPAAIPVPIENFKAVSGSDCITLSWNKVKENCDYIEIVREQVVKGAASRTKGAKKKTIKVQAGDCSFKDTDKIPGVEFKYQIHSVLKNEHGADASEFAVFIDEVKKVSARYEKGAVYLSWEMPGTGSNVVVYRRQTVFKTQAGSPVLDGSEERLFSSDNATIKDENIAEGVTYYYIIVVDYGKKIFSVGVQTQVEIPKPPPAVKRLTAEHSFSGGKNIVALNWPKVSTAKNIMYALVRNQGKIAPVSIKDGEVIYQGRREQYLDQDTISGCQYSYSVFSCKGDLFCKTPASSKPVDIIAEVSDLKAVTANSTIELTWTSPENVSDIIIRRNKDYFPVNYNDGAKVVLQNINNAKDDNVTNGQQYFYRVICVYRFGSTEKYSEGVTISATPDQEPELIDGYLLKVKDGSIAMSWKTPSYSDAVIIKTRVAFENTVGDLWEINDLSKFNDRIPVTGNNRAVDLTPDIDIPYYSLISMAGQYARYCGTLLGTFVPDVKDLELSRSRDGVILRWTWPKDCNAVQILKKYDDYPGDVTDETSTRILVSRNDYIDNGDKYLDSIKHSTGHIYYRIFTQVQSKNEVLFSAGTSLGCYHDIHITPWMYLKYHFVFSNKQTNLKGKLKLHWSVKNKLENFAGFCLIANLSEVPSSPEDGIELFRWTPQDGDIMRDNEAIIDLEEVRRERWPKFLYKAFLLDPSQSRHAIIVHPNYTVSISEKGNISVEKLKSLKRHYTGKIPKTIICPECFQEFPLNKMLYTSEITGEIKALKYSFLDKLRRKRPKAPHDSEGRTMLQKLCPDQRHELPYTAGTQDNLIIGLVGASASGKSHYICSLINRFEKQTGMDFNVAIVPVTAGTQARYKREFYDPLFMNKSELEKTVGEKPPLIYNLTFSGELWGERHPRSITLALYDTAGDHFNDPKQVAQMVKYLGKASGVVFLVDPLQSVPVYETLPDEIKKKILKSPVPPSYIFSNVLRVMEAESDGNLARIPVAVTLSKCDVLEDLQYFNSNSLWSSDSRHIGFYDRELHDDMTALITECMRKWCTEAYQTVESNFPRHAFFGVSATGCCSNASNKYKYVSPHRVEEPFLWILSELGVIPSR